MPEPAPPVTESLVEAPPPEAPGSPPPWVMGGSALFALLVVVLAFTLLRGARGGRAPAPIAEVVEVPEAAIGEPEPVRSTVEEVRAPEVRAPEGIVGRMRGALERTRNALRERLAWGAEVDESSLENLEEALLAADVGPTTTARLLAPLKERLRAGERDPESLRSALRTEVRRTLDGLDPRLVPPPGDGPYVILVVGVNGSGKTTTIGKLAARFVRDGRRVLLAAGDTYRAAAIDQLRIWAERAGADLVAHQEGADPGAVAFDALASAKAKGHDVVIIDTAGRLQTIKPLMEQLSKVRRVIARQVPDAPHETLLVLDGTMGQNGLSQARLFHEAAPLTGVVVTKLDGTAKGGMVLTLAAELGLPVKLVGLGEKIEDLADFDADAFAAAVA